MELAKGILISEVALDIRTISEFLKTLDSAISYKKDNLLSWFKKLCAHLTRLLMLITKSSKKIRNNSENGEMLQYLNQLLSYLLLLINIFTRESDEEEHLSIARSFCVKQMRWCLEGIQETFSKSNSNKDLPGSFIKWMDLALDKMNEIDYENQESKVKSICDEAKSLFEEVLSHAMSIAQVALTEDRKIIRGRSEVVLEALDGLVSEINKTKPNTPMVNLLVDTCSNELCALERRVNTAVLKLSLKVFSEYTEALESIHSFCFESRNQGKSNELDALVVEFDLHVDRIMQIGIFAVSCSTCVKNCIKIKSCLANLEALETELVPSFNSVLQDPTPHNIQQTLLLEEHWLNQAHNLKKLIYLIIDPFAFCQVIYEENKQLLEDISDGIKVSNSSLDKSKVKVIVKQSRVLKEFMDVILEEQKETDVEKIGNKFNDFKKVLHELHSALEILPDEKNNYLRIIKRATILKMTIQILWNCFQDDEVNKENSTTKEHQLDATANKCLMGNPFLDHMINRGAQILKDRSILYPSMSKNGTFKIRSTTMRKLSQLKTGNKSLPLSKLVHLRKLSFMNSMVRNDSCSELQITDILNELNNMTNSSLGTI